MRRYALGAGLGFLALAMLVQGVLPAAIPESRETRATRAVRTGLGELAWVWHEAAPYTELERRGRAVYQREGCWYCHSQYVRPVAGEERRWGPVAEVGEYAHDRPHLLSTRRIGPDLARVGLKYDDGWHYAHHFMPGLVVPGTVMPAFPWLYRTAAVPVVVRGGAAGLADTGALRELFSHRAGALVLLYPSPAGLAFAADTDGVPTLVIENLPPPWDRAETWQGRTLTVVVPGEDLRGLVAYLQKLGMNRGAWREAFEPAAVTDRAPVPTGGALASRGRAVYARRCAACHGERGDGNGPAATFLDPRPRDFTLGTFKFRSTPSGSLPTDADLERTLVRGVRWTAMPPWHELPAGDRAAVIAHMKTFSPRWTGERPEPPVAVGEPPRPTPALLARGAAVFVAAQCAQCHGEGGRGDGPSAGELRDDWKFPIRPTDFTRGQFRGGGGVRDIYRALTTGLDGTPMPSYADSLTDEERWAVSYQVLAFSAFTDPLTGKRLALDRAARSRLDGPEALRHPSPELALDPDVGGLDQGKSFARFFRGLRGEGR